MTLPVVLCAVGGCGGGGSAANGEGSLVDGWAQAVARGDTTTACRLSSDQTIARFGGPERCPAALRARLRGHRVAFAGHATKRDLRGVTFLDIFAPGTTRQVREHAPRHDSYVLAVDHRRYLASVVYQHEEDRVDVDLAEQVPLGG